jgi:hypothetical protein
MGEPRVIIGDQLGEVPRRQIGGYDPEPPAESLNDCDSTACMTASCSLAMTGFGVP